MKTNKLFLGLMAVGLSLAGLTQSCVSDVPFVDGEGEGSLRMKLVVNSDLTRAQVPADELADSCVLYVSGNRGLFYSFKGIDNIPSEIKLKSGHYVAEAWTGDSVTASWSSDNKRFFRGYQEFDIQESNENSVVVTCKIANVVVSLDKNSVMPELGDDWTLTVFNSRGALQFNKDNMDSEKAYFMMPNSDIAVNEDGSYVQDDPGFTKYTNLKYRIEGTNAAGKHFEKEDFIGVDGSNLVQHAHEYRLTLKYNPEYEATGGSFISIIVSDKEMVIESEVGIYSRPAIKGTTFDLAGRIKGEQGGFTDDQILKISAFNGIENLQLIPENGAMGVIPAGGIDLKGATSDKLNALEAAGIKWDEKESGIQEDLFTSYITFKKEFLNSLEDKDEEYKLMVKVVDGNGRENSAVVRIIVGEVEIDPIVPNPVNPAEDLLQVRATYATITGMINDNAETPQLRYRICNSAADWKYVNIYGTRAESTFTVKLTGLTPGTEYEYQAVSGEFVSSSLFFKTESADYVIPNWDMETWSTYSFQTKLGNKTGIPFPGPGSAPSFWSSGNAGSSMANIKLTEASTEMKRSGQYSARLKSQSAMGMMAAGNLLVGDFVGMPTLTTAEVSFGRPYDGSSHPDALSVWANYRPAQVTSEGQGLTKSMKDHGQIFIAFATSPSVVNTNTKTYFNPKGANILGYGEITWEGVDFGKEGQLEQVVIPITWYEKAKTVKPTYIIIVASASKYGDYFVGGAGSVMYLDDFELIYNDN